MRYLDERQMKLKYVLHSLDVATEDADEHITMKNGDTLNLHVVVALIQICGGGLGYDIDWSKLDSPDCDGLCDDIETLQADHIKQFASWTPPRDLVDSIANFETLYNWFYQEDGVHERELMNDVDDWLCLLLAYHTLWADPCHGRSDIFRTRQLIGEDQQWKRWDNEDIFKQVERALREIRLIP